MPGKRTGLTSIDFVVCFSHQNEGSGTYASGTAKFADAPNDDLGEVLAKSHDIQVCMHCHPDHTAKYKGVANDKGRKPVVIPSPGTETSWGGEPMYTFTLSVCASSMVNS